MPNRSPADEHVRLVTPAQLLFAVSEKSTHKQALDVCNPFKFAVRYKAFSTAPDCYNVVPPEGDLPPLGHCFVVVHFIKSAAASRLDTLPTESFADSFKFCLYRKADDKFLAESVVQAGVSKQILKRASGPPSPPAPVNDSRYPISGLHLSQRTSATFVASRNQLTGHATPEGQLPQVPQPSTAAVPSILTVTIGLLATCVLLFPSEGELAEMAPSMLRPNAMQRQLAAFVLGMVVFAILRW